MKNLVINRKAIVPILFLFFSFSCKSEDNIPPDNTVTPSTFEWNVTEKPPVLENPLEYVLSADYKKMGWPAYGAVGAGQIIRLVIPADRDARITFSGTTPITVPVLISGGRNVHIIGLHISLEVQPGNNTGELPNYVTNSDGSGSWVPKSSVHPRCPLGGALYVGQANISFIEGCIVELNGIEGDCIIIRNDPSTAAPDIARAKRDIIVQNCAFDGWESHGKSDVGDGIHGDLSQNQAENLRRLVFENVTALCSAEGITQHSYGGYNGCVDFKLRRFEYGPDDRYINDDPYDKLQPLALAVTGIKTDKWSFEDVYIHNGQYLNINSDRYGSVNSGTVVKYPGIYAGKLPNGERFAPKNFLGANYKSPHLSVTALNYNKISNKLFAINRLNKTITFSDIITNVKLYTLQGQLVLSKNNDSREVDMSKIQNGIYLMDVSAERERIRMKLFL